MITLNAEIKALQDRAEKARLLYKRKLITRCQAVSEIQPYVEAFNEKSQSIAKKYNQRPKLMNISSFLR